MTMSRGDTATGRPRSPETLALGLGWFSIGLGLAELAAPQSVARFIGVPSDDRTLAVLRSYGAREVGTGLAILAQPHRSTWLWSRVAGDALDLATLAGAASSPHTNRNRLMFAAASVASVAVLDALCARRLAEGEQNGTPSDRRAGSAPPRGRQPARVVEAVTINRPIEQVESRWRDGSALPGALRALTGPAREGTRADVRFKPAPGGRGTEVRVEVEFTPGPIGAVFARLFGGDPTGQIRHELRRFKQIVETGEVTLSDGPSLWRAAQPAETPQEIRHAAGVGV